MRSTSRCVYPGEGEVARSAAVICRNARVTLSVARALAAIRWRSRVARDAAVGLELALDCSTRLLLLDAGGFGVEACRVCLAARARRPELPIIAWGNLDSDQRLAAFRAGADDIVREPVDVRELQARIEARLRLAHHGLDVCVGPLWLEFRRRRALYGGAPLRLAGKEFALLHCLAERVGQQVSLDVLAREVWGHPVPLATATYRMHVSKLRKKLNGHPDMPTIRCIAGGYVLTCPESDASSRGVLAASAPAGRPLEAHGSVARGAHRWSPPRR